MAASNGLCRYGARVDCCWGWTRHSWGHCQREYRNRLLVALLLLLLGRGAANELIHWAESQPGDRGAVGRRGCSVTVN